jgi:hypothetical protein
VSGPGFAGLVVAAGGAGVSVAEKVLHHVQRMPAAEQQGGDAVPQGVGRQGVGALDPGGCGDPAYGAEYRRLVQLPPGRRREQRPGRVAAVGQVAIQGGGGERWQHEPLGLPPLTGRSSTVCPESRPSSARTVRVADDTRHPVATMTASSANVRAVSRAWCRPGYREATAKGKVAVS